MTDYADGTPYDPTVLHTVSDSAQAIRTKTYGKDTREAMAQMGEKLVAEMTDTGYNGAETRDARGTFNTLGARENNQDTQIATKSDKSYVDAMLASIAQGGPKGLYYSLSALQTAYPSGADGTYLVFDSSQTDGAHSYIWDSSASVWKDLGAYSTGGSISGLSSSSMSSSYPDLNYVPTNSILVYSTGLNDILNTPISDNLGGTVLTYSYIKTSDNSKYGGTVQIVTIQDGRQFKRIAWGNTVTWSDWEELTGNIKVDAFINSSTTSAPYSDLNNLKPNTLVTYSSKQATSNYPDTVSGSGFSVLTLANTASAISQFLYESNGNSYLRNKWGSSDWSSWTQLNIDTSKIAISKGIQYATNTSLKDFNALGSNTVYTFVGLSNISNIPDSTDLTGCTILTQAGSSSYPFQLCLYTNGRAFVRQKWGSTPTYTSWQELTYDATDFSLSVFEKVGVIGDSYASGELWTSVADTGGTGTDVYSKSWLQILARQNGFEGINFSKGGLTTRTWLTDDHGLSLLNSSDSQELYLISLGINDTEKLGTSYLGTIDDVESGTDTFYGNYGKIIKAIQAKSPSAKIVLINLAKTDGDYSSFNTAISNIASHFTLPCLKQQDDRFFSTSLYLYKMVGGHPRSIVYSAMAQAFERLIKKCVLENYSYFSDLGM